MNYFYMYLNFILFLLILYKFAVPQVGAYFQARKEDLDEEIGKAQVLWEKARDRYTTIVKQKENFAIRLDELKSQHEQDLNALLEKNNQTHHRQLRGLRQETKLEMDLIHQQMYQELASNLVKGVVVKIDDEITKKPHNKEDFLKTRLSIRSSV